MIEVEASYEENYHSSPTDKFIMSRMSCSLRGTVGPGQTEELVFVELQRKCQKLVKSAIEAATYIDPDPGF